MRSDALTGVKAAGLSGRLRAVRKRLPRGFRTLYRLFGAVDSDFAGSPILPPELFEGARFMASRQALVASLPPADRALEVGTDTGAFARFILDHARPKRLDIIDIDYSRFDQTLAEDPRVHCHTGRSAEVLARFEPASFDWVYIDASHRYDDVVADARAAARVVRPGGFLVFNDYAHVDPFLGRYGVHKAVSEFLVETRFLIYALSYNRMGLYDLAIRATAALKGTNGS